MNRKEAVEILYPIGYYWCHFFFIDFPNPNEVDQCCTYQCTEAAIEIRNFRNFF